MDFVLVAVPTQVVEMPVGLVQVADRLAGEIGGKPLLPEQVFAFDLALGLGRERVMRDADLLGDLVGGFEADAA